MNYELCTIFIRPRPRWDLRGGIATDIVFGSAWCIAMLD